MPALEPRALLAVGAALAAKDPGTFPPPPPSSVARWRGSLLALLACLPALAATTTWIDAVLDVRGLSDELESTQRRMEILEWQRISSGGETG